LLEVLYKSSCVCVYVRVFVWGMALLIAIPVTC
jgi:hypothetical protein